MSDFVEWIPKHHGHKPDYWTPDTLTGLDNKHYVRQPNWAWIAGTTYYVPYEAVHGMSRDVDELLTDGAGTLDDYQRGALDERAKIVAWLRGFATDKTDELADILETQWPFDKEK